MKRLACSMLCLGASLFAPLPAYADAETDVLGVSGCVSNGPGLGITCDMYETEGGVRSERSDIVSIPAFDVVAGFVIILEPGTPAGADVNDPQFWSDVLEFTPLANSPTLSDTVRLFSDPSLPSIPVGAARAFVVETADPTIYNNLIGSVGSIPNPRTPTEIATYRIHSDLDVPEPATALLAALGLGLGVWMRRRG